MFSPLYFLIGLLHPIFLYFCGKNTYKISYTKNPKVAQQKAYEEINTALKLIVWVGRHEQGLATVGSIFIRFILLQYACRASTHRAGF